MKKTKQVTFAFSNVQYRTLENAKLFNEENRLNSLVRDNSYLTAEKIQTEFYNSEFFLGLIENLPNVTNSVN